MYLVAETTLYILHLKENYSCNMQKAKDMQTFKFMWTTGIREQTLIDLILSG